MEGHAGGPKVIVTVASGGVYAGTPLEAYDHEIPYLRHILGFIGISDVTFIQAGGTSGVAQGKILEQIQLLLGHASVQTTERYLGCKQKLSKAVNDNVGLEDNLMAGHGTDADFGSASIYR